MTAQKENKSVSDFVKIPLFVQVKEQSDMNEIMKAINNSKVSSALRNIQGIVTAVNVDSKTVSESDSNASLSNMVSIISKSKELGLLSQVKVRFPIDDALEYSDVLSLVNKLASIADRGVHQIILSPTTRNNSSSSSSSDETTSSLIPEDAIQSILEECYGVDIEGDSMRERIGWMSDRASTLCALQHGVTRIACTSLTSKSTCISYVDALNIIKSVGKSTSQ